MTQPQQFGGGEALQKAEDYAAQHPEQADAGLDKAEQILRERTGGRFDDLISTGREAIDDDRADAGAGKRRGERKSRGSGANDEHIGIVRISAHRRRGFQGIVDGISAGT